MPLPTKGEAGEEVIVFVVDKRLSNGMTREAAVNDNESLDVKGHRRSRTVRY